MDEIVESENMDVTTIVTPSNVKTVESNLKSVGVKNNGDAVEPKTARMNSFRPPVIKDWNSDDESKREPKKLEQFNVPKTRKSGKINIAGASVNTTGARTNTAIRPINTVGSKPTVNHPRSISNTYKKGYSQVTRLFNTNKNSIFNKTFNTVRVKDTTASRRSTRKKELLTVVAQGTRLETNDILLSMEIMMVDLFPLEMVKVEFFEKVLLRVPRKDNIYSVDLKSIVLTKGLNCLFAKAIIDESNLWHRRLSHTNFKNMNKLVRGNLVRVFTDDFSRFSWVFFLATKDETSGILKTFITEIENQLDHKVKVIRCDNGTEFKNSVMNQFCKMKGIKREFSVARTPQQNGVAERRNRTLIEAARTMLVDSKLPTTFWAEAVNTACYVLNRVLVIKPHNKTPYELIRGRTPLIDFMKPFGCPVTILNTRDHLGKFDGKADEGFFVGYSVVSKAMRVFNKRTRIVEETLNIRFLENTPNVTGNGPDWLFDVDSLTISMNYVPVVAGNQTNGIAGTRDNIVADPKVSEEDAEEKTTEMDKSGASDKNRENDQATRSDFERLLQQEKQTVHTNSTNSINTISTPVSTAGPSCTDDDLSSPVNAAEASNAFEEHLFEQFSPFKNAFTSTCFKCDSKENDQDF
ncbi:putative ribonuclease H-like domain-containing protein [Tanacetum coccineum]